MTSARLASIALVVSILALVFTFMDPSGSSRAAESSAGFEAPAAVDPRIDALSLRLEELENSIEGLQLRADPLPSNTREPAQSQSAATRDLEPRLAILESWVKSQKEVRSVLLERIGKQRRADDEEAQMTLQSWEDQAKDPTSTPEQMLRALSRLRGQRLADGSDARIPVLPELLHLAQTSDVGNVRADVWRQMDGVTEPDLLTALLYAIQNDTHAKSREEAAETLGPYLPNAEVEAVLRFAKENDEDDGVREQAGESLTKRRR